MKKLYNFISIVIIFLISLSEHAICFIDNIPDSSKVFYLGGIEIFADKSDQLSPFHQTILQISNSNDRQNIDVSHSLRMLAGLNISKVGARNESMVYIRGYDLRQVPVFIDGIPEYIPYDGYVDMSRFISLDISRISVSKGFSSVLFGPNAMGGAINLISRKPSLRLDYDISGGVVINSGYNYSVNVGSNQSLYYFMGSVSKIDQKSFRLSKSFTATTTEDGGERDNSYREDTKYNFKLGFTPNETDEYSFSYMNQQGEKGNPVYTGISPNIPVRYWRWPKWDKISKYFISQTMLGNKETNDNIIIKLRLFNDKFKNTLRAFDDASYSTQNNKSSFNSYFDDDSWGIMLESKTKYFSRHNTTLAFNYKHDIHRENNLGEPIRLVRDATVSVGIEDVYKMLENFSLVGGLSYNVRKSLQAQDYNSKTGAISDFPKDNTNAWNIQLGGIYDISSMQQILFSVARKTRFATMKDRYSYKLGIAIPNPYLIPENAINYDISFYGKLNEKDFYKVSAFFNDIKDVITLVNNVQGSLSQMQNMGKARYYGVEVELNAHPTSAINIETNYTFLKRKNISDPTLKFINTPEHKLILNMQINTFSILEIAGEMESNSEQYSTSDGIYKAGAFTLFNLKSVIKVSRNIQIYMGIDNIFDRNYSIVEGYPEAGRTVYMYLRLYN